MSIKEPATCGKGLAERSVLPARLSALCNAMADVLERHQRTLDLTDDNARTEDEAYEVLAHDYRNIATLLQNTADRMASYQDSPAARHDARAIVAPGIRDAFANLIDREHDLMALIKRWIEQDHLLLVTMRQSASG